jgi:plastocyanin
MRTMPGLFLLLAVVGCGTGPAAGPMASSTPADRPAAHDDMPDMPAHAAKPRDPAKAAKAPAANQIVIDNFAFAPNELTVPIGAEVTWVNQDDVPHTATSTTKPKAFDSGTLDTDQTYSHAFSKAGEYEYFCAVHPKMTGRIIVK